MRNLAIFGRPDMPRAPFGISRDICATEYPVKSRKGGKDLKSLNFHSSTPPTLPKIAKEAFRTAWTNMLDEHQDLRRKVHPQTTATDISLLYRHEIISNQRNAAYRQLAKKLLELNEDITGSRATFIGPLSLKKVTTHKVGDNYAMILQPVGVENSGVNTLRKQRLQSIRALGELASPTAFQADPETEALLTAGPLDVGIVLANFSRTIEPELCDHLASQVQNELDDYLADPLSRQALRSISVKETRLCIDNAN